MDLPCIEKLKEIVTELQKIMRIQDWDIEIEVVNGVDLHNKGLDGVDCNTMGYADRNIKLNEATICINKDNLGKENEWYSTLVHELFHVQSTYLISTANAYFNETHSYFEALYEAYTERLAKMFCSIYPVTNFIKEVPNET